MAPTASLYSSRHAPLLPSTLIRPAAPADLDQLVALCAEHAAYEDTPFDPDGKANGLHRLLFEMDDALFGLVVEQDDVLVGFATWSRQVSTWDAAFYAHLDCLFLIEAVRGRGIGRRLVAQVARDATRAGCAHMQWQTPPSNHRAIRFYERLGTTSKPKARFYLDASALHRLTADHA